MPRLARLACLAATLCAGLSIGLSGTAMANNGWAGSDPASNYAPGPLPASCSLATSAACIDAVVADLDAARANLGQPPYKLPSNFDSLPADDQNLVLTDLDRVQYGLPPVQGVTAALDQNAMTGVQNDVDPQPTAGNYTMWGSNWAGGDVNMPMAYYWWMYADGPGSGNLDCTPTNSTGCWGHRHNVLMDYGSGGPLALGAAAGLDSGGNDSYAMLIFGGDDTYSPSFTYTWAQAVASGANGGVAGGTSAPTGSSPSPKGPVATAAGVRLRIAKLRVHGHRVTVNMVSPAGAGLSCALSRHRAHGWSAAKFRSCTAVTVFSHVARGRYRLRVRAAHSLVSRHFRVR